MAPFVPAGQAFELMFSCSHPLPELSAAVGDAAPAGHVVDVAWMSPLPSQVLEAPAGDGFVVAGDTFKLRVPGVATYSVTADRIVITPEPGADDRSIRAYLFGSAIGVLLHLRGLTVLHGSAVALPDGSAAVFCGQSTAGKSTLAAALAARGHPALADDITAVRFDAAGQAWCLPGLARTKLWRDAIDTLGLAHHTSADTRVLPQLDKHTVPLATAARPVPLSRFYELQAHDGGGPLSFQPVSGMDKVTLLLTHGYRPAYALAMGRQPALLRGAAALARQLEVDRIVRPRNEPTLGAIVQWLEAQWAQ